tara:strand:+ start:586 stop:999 length:414 start_codon:yes stop_codon:yes gene_type:complete
MELVKDTTKDDLRRMCKSILDDVCDGIFLTEKNIEDWDGYGYEIGDRVEDMDWIGRNVYDERYVLNFDCELIEVQLMVAGGGPSIWVHCSANSVEVHGYWGGDHVKLDAFYRMEVGEDWDGLGVWGYYNEMAEFKRA